MNSFRTSSERILGLHAPASFLLPKSFLMYGMGMGLKVKARYEDKVLKPLEAVDLEEGEELEIEISHSVVDRTYSMSKLSDELIEEILVTTERGE
jgi:predicted DNA-binding antitoxin AbrB/MazE fold protein